MNRVQNHINSRRVKIYRSSSFLDGVQTAAQDFLSLSKKSIGSYYLNSSTKTAGSGLTLEEKDLLLSIQLNLPKDDRDFRREVERFYQSLITRVPYGEGLELEIGLSLDNSKPVTWKNENGDQNLPIDIMDFIRYRHALGHPRVARSQAEASGNSLKEFYIFDRNEVEEAAQREASARDQSTAIYLRLKDDNNKVVMMLTVLGIDTRTITGRNAVALRQQKLRELSDSDPVTFLKTYNDSQFEFRYLVKALENAEILRKIGGQYVDNETGNIIGHDLEETIYYFKDSKNNSQQISLFKAKLQDVMNGIITESAPKKAEAKAAESEEK